MRASKIEQESLRKYVSETERSQVDLAAKTEGSINEIKSSLSHTQRSLSEQEKANEQRAAKADFQFSELMKQLQLMSSASSLPEVMVVGAGKSVKCNTFGCMEPKTRPANHSILTSLVSISLLPFRHLQPCILLSSLCRSHRI